MRQTRRCPKCDGRKIWIVDPLAVPDEAGRQVRAIPVATAAFKPDDAWLSDVFWAGDFQAYVCDGCGFTELYAQRLHHLERLAKHTEVVRLVEVDPGGEYR